MLPIQSQHWQQCHVDCSYVIRISSFVFASFSFHRDVFVAFDSVTGFELGFNVRKPKTVE